jgi:hypothetical protein
MLGVVKAGSLDLANLGIILFQALGFFVVAFGFGQTVLPWLGRLVQNLGKTATFTFVLLVGFLYAEVAELVGMHGILGMFLAGLLLREKVFGRSLSNELMDLVRHASIGFLAPIFFVTAGFAVSLDVFNTDLWLLVGITGLAMIGKIIGTAIFYLPTGHGWREGITIGAGMNGRGAVEIIIAQIGLSMGIISQEIFSILVVMAIATTATVPVFLKWGVDWLKGRNELVRSDSDKNGVLILGAGPTARALGGAIAESQPVWLVDSNADHCAIAEKDGLQTVCGNALDERVLSEAHASEVRHLVALTDNAEVNALVAQMAREVFYVPEVHLLETNSGKGRGALLQHLEATTAFAGPVSISDWDYLVEHGSVERFSVPVAPGLAPSEFFSKLQKGQPVLPLVLRRADSFVPFNSGVRLRPGDRLTVLQAAQSVKET